MKPAKKLEPRKPRIMEAAPKARAPRAPKVRARKSDKTPDPLENVRYTDIEEQDAALELTAMQQAYRERARNEANRFYAATDSEYWTCICFDDRAERERFLKARALDRDSKYILGRDIAAALGIEY